MNFETVSTADVSIPELVDILNRGFAGYFVPIQFNPSTFLGMVRRDGIDLTISRLLLADGAPVGIALLARRGWTSRIAAMGIAGEMRGRGAGSRLMDQIVQEACGRGERAMVLEVIEQNQAAIHLYRKHGFEIMRRLVGYIRTDAVERTLIELQEVDIREAAGFLAQYGLADLPWQLSPESIAQFNPPARAFRQGQAYIVISNPEPNDVVVWSLCVAPDARRDGLGTRLLKAVMTQYSGKTWHVPAILPEELGPVFVSAGFVREELSQWQMKLRLPQTPREDAQRS